MYNLSIKHVPQGPDAALDTVVTEFSPNYNTGVITEVLEYFTGQHGKLTAIAEMLTEPEEVIFQADEGGNDSCTMLVLFPGDGSYNIEMSFGLYLELPTLQGLFYLTWTYLNLLVFSRHHPGFLEGWKNEYGHTPID